MKSKTSSCGSRVKVASGRTATVFNLTNAYRLITASTTIANAFTSFRCSPTPSMTATIGKRPYEDD